MLVFVSLGEGLGYRGCQGDLGVWSQYACARPTLQLQLPNKRAFLSATALGFACRGRGSGPQSVPGQELWLCPSRADQWL